MKLRHIWLPFVKTHLFQVAGIILVGLFTSYCTLLLPLSLGKFMEIMAGSGTGKTKALQLLGISLPDDLTIFFSFFFIILGLKFVLSWLHNWRIALLGELFVAGLRLQLLNYRRESNPAGIPSGKASLLMPFSNDLKTVRSFFTIGVIGFVTDLLFFLMGLYILVRLSPSLTAAVLAMTGIFFFIHRWYNRQSKPVFAEKRKLQAAVLNLTADLLLHKEGQEAENRQNRLERKTGKLQKNLIKFHGKKSFLKALSPFMFYLMLAIIMAIISSSSKTARPEPGTIMTYILLLMTLFPTLRNLIRIENTWVMGHLAAEKFTEAVEKKSASGGLNQKKSEKTTNTSFSLLH